MRAVLIASGDPHPDDARWLDGADLVIAVDAGAAWIVALGVRPDALVGDLDSVDPQLVAVLEADGVAVERHPTSKDRSDTELAIAYARRRGVSEIVLIGAFGGPRIDHEIANVLLLSSAAERLLLVRGQTRLTAVRGGDDLALEGLPGALVSLFALGGDALGVTTQGLEYPLRDETLLAGSSRGLSNVIAAKPASVGVRQGALLVIEQPGEGDETQ
jgi:thiamine pyrophosphokinase